MDGVLVQCGPLLPQCVNNLQFDPIWFAQSFHHSFIKGFILGLICTYNRISRIFDMTFYFLYLHRIVAMKLQDNEVFVNTIFHSGSNNHVYLNTFYGFIWDWQEMLYLLKMNHQKVHTPNFFNCFMFQLKCNVICNFFPCHLYLISFIKNPLLGMYIYIIE